MRLVNSLKFKFAAGIFIVVTAVTIVLGFVSYEYEKRAVENRLYSQLNAIADLKKELVVGYLNERKNDLKILASGAYVKKYVAVLLDPSSPPRVRKTACQYILERLNSFQQVYPGYRKLEIVSLKGSVLASSENQYNKTGIASSSGYTALVPRHAKAFSWGSSLVLQNDISSGEIDIGMGIKNEKGLVSAVVISSISLADTLFPSFTDYTGLGRTGETLLMRRSGKLISYISPLRYPPLPIDGYAMFGDEYRKLAMIATAGNEGLDRGIDYRGKVVVGAYRYIPDLGWGVETKIDRDEAFSEIIAIRQRTFLMGFVTLAIMLAIAYWIGKQLTSPISKLMNNTKAITAGRFAVLTKSGRTDEIGELEENFNEMVVALEAARRQAGLKQKDLEIQVAERTAHLARANAALSKALQDIQRETEEKKSLHAQLLHSQKMEAVGTLAGGIAHDFNNILTAIIGYGNVMRMKLKDTDPHREYLDHILAAAERAAGLTHSLLAFSRKQIINPQPVALNEIITRVQKLLARLIGEDIELRIDLCNPGPTILADSGQLEQLLMNLATNARDAMPSGGCFTLATELANIDEQYTSHHGYGEAGEYAVVSVSDTGMGMDEQIRARIFEPFFTTKETGKGTGLGLSIVYGIVKAQKGYINCYSEPGKGTTFKIYLPLIHGQAGIGDAAEIRHPQGGRETILVAEDNEEVRKLTVNILGEFGYTVIEALDGDDAVKKFMENRGAVNLLLFDIIMPHKNGKDAFDEIRKIRPDIKAIFTSGYTADIVRQRGFLDEGLTLLTKPLSPRDLLTKIREVLDS